VRSRIASWMMVSVVSAFRMSRTSRPEPSTYLTPFALWTAFPPADYYEVSVAMGPPLAGLEPFRRSRVSSSGHESSAV
jgi:hypothetical protein